MKKTYVGVLGIIFIVLGVLGSLGILLSFDWETYNHYKELTIYEEEAALMRGQMLTVIVYSGAALLVNAAIGVLLMALDDIINLLKKTKD